MKKKLIEIIYHRLQVKDVEDYRIRFKPACLLVEAFAKHFEVQSFKAALFNHSISMDSAQYHFANKRFYKLWIPFAFHLRIKECQPDVVLIHGTFNHFQIIHLKWLLGNQCKLLVQHHGERPRGWMKKRLLKWSSGSVDAYLFTSREAGIEMGLPENKIRLIMEGSTEFSPLNKENCRKELGLDPTEKVYLWVGRLIPLKNPLFLLKGFREFSLSHPEVKLYLFYHEETLLKDCIEITATTDRVKFLGRGNQVELRRWYSAADFFVSASQHEGSGYALCEAMACGCVPIVPSIGSFQFMTENGECALLYESGNADSLQNKLEISLHLDLNQWKDKVLEQFAHRLSFESIAKNLVGISETL